MQRLQNDSVPATASVRLDTDTVRQVLARASTLEQQRNNEQEALSFEQVEELGRELGISSDAVRRALGEITHPVSAHLPVAQTRNTNQVRQSDVKAALVPGLWYGLANGVILLTMMGASESISVRNRFGALALVIDVLLAFVLPPIVSAVAGWRSQHIRTGALGGFFLNSTAFLIDFLIVLAYSSRHQTSGFLGLPPEIWALLVLMIPICTLFGALGGGARRWWEQLGKNER